MKKNHTGVWHLPLLWNSVENYLFNYVAGKKLVFLVFILRAVQSDDVTFYWEGLEYVGSSSALCVLLKCSFHVQNPTQI